MASKPSVRLVDDDRPFADAGCDCHECGEPIENETPPPVSHTRTPWAVWCERKHGRVFLTSHEYRRQLGRADSLWTCPICPGWNATADWDDDNFEDYQHYWEEQHGEQV